MYNKLTTIMRDASVSQKGMTKPEQSPVASSDLMFRINQQLEKNADLTLDIYHILQPQLKDCSVQCGSESKPPIVYSSTILAEILDKTHTQYSNLQTIFDMLNENYKEISPL